MSQATLFDLPEPATVTRPTPTPEPKLSADARRTLRQAAALAAGRHPLDPVAERSLRLHAESAPADDRHAPGRRCGNCWYRQLMYTNGNRQWPKCVFGAENPTDAAEGSPGPRVSRSAASDVRGWWPACTDHSYGDPRLSDDAARWVPTGGIQL